MRRTTGPIEFTHVSAFSIKRPLPWYANFGGVVWISEYYNPNSPVYTALALDELVESVSGSVGISLDAGSASAITVWLNNVPIGDVEPGETLEISFFDVPVLARVADYVNLFEIRVTRIGDFNGELLEECPFTLTSLTVDFTVANDEEPSGECFWTDLLNVTEDCGDGPSPVGDAIAVWPWDAWLWDHVLWNPDVAPVVLPELTERQTRTFALGDLLDGYGDVIDSCNNVLSGVKFDGSRMYTDPLEQGRNGCTGPSYRVSVALTPKDDVLRTMHAQDGGAFYPDLQIGYGYGVAAKAHVNVTGEFRLFGVTSNVSVFADLVEAGTSLSGSVPVFVGTPTGAWTPFDEASVEWPDLFYEGQNHEVMFGFNGVASYPAATFALDMEIEVVAERQARVVAKIVNLQGWDEDPDMEGFGLPEEPGDPLPGVIYIAEDILFESGGYIMSSVNEPVYYYGLVVGDLITVDPYTGEELENHGKMKVRFSAGG